MCLVERLIFPKDNNQRLKHKSCSVDLSRRKHPECYGAAGSAMKVALAQQPARSLFSGYFLNLGGLAFTRRISARNHVQRNVPLNAVIILDTRQPTTLIESPRKTLEQFARFTSTATNDDSLATRTTNSLLFAFNCTEGAVRQKKRKGATREFYAEEISFSSRFLSSEYYIVSVCFSLMAQKCFTLGSVLVYKRKTKFPDDCTSRYLENVLRNRREGWNLFVHQRAFSFHLANLLDRSQLFNSSLATERLESDEISNEIWFNVEQIERQGTYDKII